MIYAELVDCVNDNTEASVVCFTTPTVNTAISYIASATRVEFPSLLFLVQILPSSDLNHIGRIFSP